MLHLRVKYSKDQTVSFAESQARWCDAFVKAIGIAKDVAKDFDGKVVNVRMERVVNAKLDADGIPFSVHLGPQLDTCFTNTGWRIEMSFKYKGFVECGPFYDEVDLVVTSGRRMDATETIAQFDKIAGYAIKGKNEWNDAAENYNTYMARIAELNAALDKYEEGRNYILCPQAWLSR